MGLSSCRGGRGAEWLWGVPRDRGARGEGAVGGGWQPWGRWAGSSEGPQAAKGTKTSCMEGGTSGGSVPARCGGGWKCWMLATEGKLLPPRQTRICRIRAVAWYQMALLGDRAPGVAEPKAAAPGHWTCSLLLHPGGAQTAAAMQWGGGVMEKGKKLVEKRGEELCGAVRDEHASHPGAFHCRLCIIGGCANLFACFQIRSSL